MLYITYTIHNIYHACMLGNRYVPWIQKITQTLRKREFVEKKKTIKKESHKKFEKISTFHKKLGAKSNAYMTWNMCGVINPPRNTPTLFIEYHYASH